MNRDDAVAILRALRQRPHEPPASFDAVSRCVLGGWPRDFTGLLAEPKHLDRRGEVACPRDWHLAGLEAALGEGRHGTSPELLARVQYHAAWLAFLGSGLAEDRPLVSLVIPTYNRGWLIDSLLENCFQQTYGNLEIIVVDDGSTDGSEERLRAYGDRITTIRQENSGVSCARNAGIGIARGEFVHFLDSDNLIHPRHIAKKVAAFAAIPDTIFCTSDALNVSLFGATPALAPIDPFRPDENGAPPPTDLLDFILARGTPFLVSATTLPRFALLRDAPAFDPDLRRGEDTRYWFKLAVSGARITHIPHPLLFRMRMTDSLTYKAQVERNLRPRIRQCIDLLQRPDLWPQLAEFLSRRWVVRHFSGLAMRSVGDAAGNEEIASLLRAVGELPETATPSALSPLPLLAFLQMLCLHQEKSAQDQPFWQALRSAAVDAMARATPIGAADAALWRERADALGRSDLFSQVICTDVEPLPSAELTRRAAQGAEFLRDLPSSDGAGSRVAEPPVRSGPRPAATLILPVHGGRKAARMTLASCKRQSVAGRLEIIVVENRPDRVPKWLAEHPDIRVITARNVADAYARGVGATTSQFVRFLRPGDRLGSRALARQLKAASRGERGAVVIEMDAEEASHRPFLSFADLVGKGAPPPLSAMLLPMLLLKQIGGIDRVLGNAFEQRFQFRLLAENVPCVPVRTRSRPGKAHKADRGQKVALAALANLLGCLGDRHLWRHIPAVVGPLRIVDLAKPGPTRPLIGRTCEILHRDIVAMANRSDDPGVLAAWTLTLIGLASTSQRPADHPDEVRRLAAAIREAASGARLDAEAVVTLSQAAASCAADVQRWTTRARAAADSAPPGSPLQLAVRRFEQALLEAAASPAETGPAEDAGPSPVLPASAPSSITDSVDVRSFWRLAATDSSVFAGFRRHPMTRRVTEIDFPTGCQYAEGLLRTAPHYREALGEFARNDSVGSPIQYDFPELGRLSSATVRHMKFLADLEALFGSLDGMNIVEIGGGWGGQCRLVKSRFKPASYTIFDLPEMAMLARRYLSALGVDDVVFRQPHEEAPAGSPDLVVSNYAISEMPQVEQDRYMARIAHATRGYVVYNAASLRERVLRHTGQDPYTAAEFAGRISGAVIELQWPLLVDRDRTKETALVRWDRSG